MRASALLPSESAGKIGRSCSSGIRRRSYYSDYSDRRPFRSLPVEQAVIDGKSREYSETKQTDHRQTLQKRSLDSQFLFCYEPKNGDRRLEAADKSASAAAFLHNRSPERTSQCQFK